MRASNRKISVPFSIYCSTFRMEEKNFASFSRPVESTIPAIKCTACGNPISDWTRQTRSLFHGFQSLLTINRCQMTRGQYLQPGAPDVCRRYSGFTVTFSAPACTRSNSIPNFLTTATAFDYLYAGVYLKKFFLSMLSNIFANFF